MPKTPTNRFKFTVLNSFSQDESSCSSRGKFNQDLGHNIWKQEVRLLLSSRRTCWSTNIRKMSF